MSDIENEKPKRKGAKKKSRTAENDQLINVEWSEATAGLDFTESTNEATDDQESLSRFEELARRVADTVSKNNSDVPEVIAEPAANETAPEIATDPEGFQLPQMDLDSLAEELTEAENDADVSHDGEPVEFVEHDRLMSIIESLLFSTDKPVSVATIKQVFKGSSVRSKDISRAIDLLASEYASPGRGVTLEEINGGYQLRTKPDNSDFLRKLAKVRPFRLSGPALEVMAIVAYKQPITKHEIDEIRGVESGHLLRALMERGMVAFGEKSELPGKPMTYQSTKKFLETFGLRNIRELPSLGEIDELLPEGIGEVEEEDKETLSDLTDQMSQGLSSSYSEGEDELSKINEQLKAVDTTSEFFEQEKVRERERRDRDRAQDIREKIVLGDAVEEKDRRWLDRYEAKLHEPKAPAETEAKAEQTEQPGDLAKSLEALSEESAKIANETAEASSDEEVERPISDDWNDDSEREA